MLRKQFVAAIDMSSLYSFNVTVNHGRNTVRCKSIYTTYCIFSALITLQASIHLKQNPVVYKCSLLFSIVYFSRYVKTCTESEDTEGTLHCCKDHGINGNGPNGIHEEGSPSKA